MYLDAQFHRNRSCAWDLDLSPSSAGGWPQSSNLLASLAYCLDSQTCSFPFIVCTYKLCCSPPFWACTNLAIFRCWHRPGVFSGLIPSVCPGRSCSTTRAAARRWRWCTSATPTATRPARSCSWPWKACTPACSSTAALRRRSRSATCCRWVACRRAPSSATWRRRRATAAGCRAPLVRRRHLQLGWCTDC